MMSGGRENRQKARHRTGSTITTGKFSKPNLHGMNRIKSMIYRKDAVHRPVRPRVVGSYIYQSFLRSSANQS